MRKLLAAALLALALMLPGGVSASTETGVAPVVLTQGDPADLQAKAPHNRTAKIIRKSDGKVIDLGGHNDNPFPSKEECAAGLEPDTRSIMLYLHQSGADLNDLDVVVECKPVGGTEA